MWKYSLILQFPSHVLFEVKSENNCSFNHQNFWLLASKQNLELCNSVQQKKKNFSKRARFSSVTQHFDT
jgi:hypothetical protein